MPRLIRESQEVTAAPPPPKQQTAVLLPGEQQKTTLTTKNEKRKDAGVNQSSSTHKRTKTQKKKKKDPNEPKHARSSYNFYSMDARPKIIATGVAHGAVNTQLGDQWKSMSAMEKLPYERMANNDRMRYIEEKAAYDAKNEMIAESIKQFGGRTTVPLAYPVKMGEQESNALSHTTSVEIAPVIDNEVVNTKKEANVANNDVPPSPQKSPESVVVDLLVDPQEKSDSLRKEGDDASTNNGNKENNDAPISKVGKGLKGLGESLASAKSGVTRLFHIKSKSQKENSSKPRNAVCADTMKSEGGKDPLGETRADSGGTVSGKSHSGEKDGDQKLPVEMKVKDDAIAANQKQANLNQGTAQLRLNSPNDDKDDGTGSQQSADLLSESCEDEGTPVASNTSHKPSKKTKAETTLSDPPQAPAHLARLTIVPLNRDDCASALKEMKGCYCEQPDYLAPVPDNDQTIARKTITLEEMVDANSLATSLEEVALGRSAVTGIKSTLISRQLCTLEMREGSASITMLKESEQHAVFLNGEPLEGPAGEKHELIDLDILSLYGPVDFAYRIQLSS
ncbi:hypothetical protein ACHAWT_005106 [Skeletonema menzelii]